MTPSRGETDGRTRRRLLVAAASGTALGSALLPLPTVAQPAGSSADWGRIGDGTVILFRHANAPGVGDPPQFKLGDCATQRNLDDTGRSQARRIGEAFRARGIVVGAVLSSQWCRTQDTAELAFPGLRRDEPAFNSFFGGRGEEERQTAAARAVIGRWKGPGAMLISTHQVNITALTGLYPTSGEGVITRGSRDGGIEVLGRIVP